MATTYRIVHQPDATPDTPYNVQAISNGAYQGVGRFCATLEEAAGWAADDARQLGADPVIEQFLTFDETVDRVRFAINNTRDLYESVADAVYYGAGESRAKFGELCAEFALCDMQAVRSVFPWLHVGYEHVCAALARIVEELER